MVIQKNCLRSLSIAVSTAILFGCGSGNNTAATPSVSSTSSAAVAPSAADSSTAADDASGADGSGAPSSSQTSSSSSPSASSSSGSSGEGTAAGTPTATSGGGTSYSLTVITLGTSIYPTFSINQPFSGSPGMNCSWGRGPTIANPVVCSTNYPANTFVGLTTLNNDAPASDSLGGNGPQWQGCTNIVDGSCQARMVSDQTITVTTEGPFGGEYQVYVIGSIHYSDGSSQSVIEQGTINATPDDINHVYTLDIGGQITPANPAPIGSYGFGAALTPGDQGWSLPLDDGEIITVTANVVLEAGIPPNGQSYPSPPCPGCQSPSPPADHVYVYGAPYGGEVYNASCTDTGSSLPVVSCSGNIYLYRDGPGSDAMDAAAKESPKGLHLLRSLRKDSQH